MPKYAALDFYTMDPDSQAHYPEKEGLARSKRPVEMGSVICRSNYFDLLYNPSVVHPLQIL